MKFRFLATWIGIGVYLGAGFSAFAGEVFVRIQHDGHHPISRESEEYQLILGTNQDGKWTDYIRLDFPGDTPLLEKSPTLTLPEADPVPSLFPARTAWVFGTANRDIPSRVRLRKNVYRRLDLDGESWFGIMRYNLPPPPEKNLVTHFLEIYSAEDLDAVCEKLWAGRHRTTKGVFAMGIPEPTTWALLAIGLVTLLLFRTAAGNREKSGRNTWI